MIFTNSVQPVQHVYNMKYYIFFILTTLSASATFGQAPSRLSPVTLGFEIASGYGGYSRTYDTWGYYTIGATAAYRFSHGVSMETRLNYLNLEGAFGGYSFPGYGYELRVFQQLRNAVWTIGPLFHFALRHGLELSLAPKAGFMLNNVSQEVNNYGRFYQRRFYHRDLLYAYDASLRMSWWQTERLAIDGSVGFFGNSDGGKALRLRSVEGTPFPEAGNDTVDNFLRDITARRGAVAALYFSLGFRFRL